MSRNFIYAFTIRNLIDSRPEPILSFLEAIKKALPIATVEYHWEVVHKLKRKFHNVHIHGMIHSPKAIFMKKVIAVPMGLHLYFGMVRCKRAYQVYITKGKLNTIDDVRDYINTLDIIDNQLLGDDQFPEEMVKPIGYNIFNKINGTI